MWDDDDFDPTAQINERVADAVAVIGIVDEVKKEPEPSVKPADKPKPKPVKASTSTTAKAYKDLSKAEIEELQKRHDMEMFASVLGMEVEKEKESGDKPNGESVEAAKNFDDLEKEIKEKEKAAAQPKTQKPAQKKKKINKEVYEDYVDDEYDNYDDKFANY